LLNKSGIKISKNSIDYADNVLTLVHVAAAQSFNGKVIRSGALYYEEMSMRIRALQTILSSMTCFTLEPSLMTFFENSGFSQPSVERIKRFTKLLNEAGILNLYQSIHANFKWIDFHGPNTD